MKRKEDADDVYCDERIDKCVDHCFPSILEHLCELLWESAIQHEMSIYDYELENDQANLKVQATYDMFANASEWFRCLASLPYDATFLLEALLDCLAFFMGEDYGCYQLANCYKIELLQLGFGFVNLMGRK